MFLNLAPAHAQKVYSESWETNRNWFAISGFRFSWSQHEFYLMLSQLETWNYNPNLQCERKWKQSCLSVAPPCLTLLFSLCRIESSILTFDEAASSPVTNNPPPPPPSPNSLFLPACRGVKNISGKNIFQIPPSRRGRGADLKNDILLEFFFRKFLNKYWPKRIVTRLPPCYPLIYATPRYPLIYAGTCIA